MLIALLWCLPGLTLVAAHAWLALRLPEPADGTALGKVPYASLAAASRLAWLTAATLAALAAVVVVPPAQRPLWLVYGSSVAVMIWVDGCTTWLPSRLMWLASAQLVAAAAWSAYRSADGLQLVAEMGIGAAAAGAFFWAFWRLSHGGLGFGDVRLAPLIGAVAATMGTSGWFAALLAGTGIGAVWGLVSGRRHPAPGTTKGFAYGPALWVGPYVALAWTALAST